MRDLILLVLLAGSNSAMAEWIRIGESADSAHYVDETTIHKSGDRVEMWDMLDYKTSLLTRTFKSVKMQTEYDCKKGQDQPLNIITYSGNLGEGDEVSNKPAFPFNSGWVPVVPDKVRKTMMEIACGKKNE
jgi:hypothetical protein